MGTSEFPEEEYKEAEDPIAQFAAEQDTARQQNRRRHDTLWQHWDQNGRQPEHMKPLIDAFKPMIAGKMKQWKFPTIPEEVVRLELTKHVISGIHSFDPSQGFALSTHVFNNAKGALRKLHEMRGTTSLPEDKQHMLRTISPTIEELRSTLEREPTHFEIAQATGVPQQQVAETLGALRRNLVSSALQSNPNQVLTPRHLEILPLMPDHIEQQHGAQARVVFEYQHGLNGRPQIDSPGDIARRMGIQAPVVSKLLNKIRKTYNEAL